MTDAAYAPTSNVLPLKPEAKGRPAGSNGDISGHLTASEIAALGGDVVRDWRRDLEGNKEWREKAEKALTASAQETPTVKNTPWQNASNVRYPLLTISALAFHSRAYAAIVKNDEAIKVKTFGADPQGMKQARATRMADYLNWKLFYQVDGWEADTDAMLLRLPTIGQHYRKVYYDPLSKQICVDSISALRLTIPSDARSLKTSPRITHDFDRHPYELQRMMAAGHYRKVKLDQTDDDDQALRLILEQHRMMDLDDDGIDEPYIVTVDEATMEVLRLEEAFGDDDVEYGEPQDGAGEDGQEADGDEVINITRWCPFVDYSFIPDPKGRAYAIGFGHLLTPIMEVINTTINMQIDAGHAQVAGGGFISQEVRLQGAGQNGSLRFGPGEYKTVNAAAADMRNAIFERTLPAPSPILFQLLGMLMEAAKDIASVNEAITGDAARTAPVGTTLALIEQGQQVFNAIYKRIYRALREEFSLFRDCVARYADPAEYARFCDVELPANAQPMGQPGQEPPQGMLPQQPPAPVDPKQLFETDFASDDLDIRPVSDPSAITKTQQIAKAQFVLGLVATGQVNPRAAVAHALQAAGVENIEELMALAPPPPPDPLTLHAVAMQSAETDAKTKDLQARAVKSRAGAALDVARAAEIAHLRSGTPAAMDQLAQHASITADQAKAFEIAAGQLPPPSPDSGEEGQ